MTLQIDGPPKIPSIDRNKMRGTCPHNQSYLDAAPSNPSEGGMPKLVCAFCGTSMLFTGQIEETEDGGAAARFRCPTCRTYTFMQTVISSSGVPSK